MGEDEPRQEASAPRLKQLRCRRVGRLVDLEEHASCPYCFGRQEDLASGQHEAFCDWKPDRDPIHFGFPPETGRDMSG